MRAALGASRRRLVRQLLTESVVLALAGGVLGLGLAVWGVSALRALEPGTLPRLQEIGWTARALAFALVLSVGTGLLFGVVPAIRALGYDLRGGLAEGGRGTVRGPLGGAHPQRPGARGGRAGLRAAGRARRCCSGASCGLQRVDPGFAPHGILTARVTLPRSRYDDPARQVAFADALLDRARALPGVDRRASASDGAGGRRAALLGHSPWPASNSPRPRWCRTPWCSGPPPSTSTLSPFRSIAAGCSRPATAATRAGGRRERGASPSATGPAGPAGLADHVRRPGGHGLRLDDRGRASWATCARTARSAAAYPQIYVPLAQVSSRVAPDCAPDRRRSARADTGAQACASPGSTPTSRSADVATMEERMAGTLARPRVNALLLAGLRRDGAGARRARASTASSRTAWSSAPASSASAWRSAPAATTCSGWCSGRAWRRWSRAWLLGLGGAAAASRVLHGLLYGVGGTDPMT